MLEASGAKRRTRGESVAADAEDTLLQRVCCRGGATEGAKECAAEGVLQRVLKSVLQIATEAAAEC